MKRNYRVKPKHQRMLWIGIGLLCIAGSLALILPNLRQHITFFYAPSELQPALVGDTIRVGGLIVPGSITTYVQTMTTTFRITDQQATLTISYTGLLPDLFREGQGIVAKGVLENPTTLRADELLAKHDENYMPREVAEALKKSGRWKPTK